jgi:putative DNA primase/helicase
MRWQRKADATGKEHKQALYVLLSRREGFDMNDVDRIGSALRFVPAYDRETWLRMGMAIKSGLGDSGFILWDGWSQQAESYKSGDARDVWRSIKSEGPVTIRTLFHEAKARGWRDDDTYRRPSREETAERKRKAAERLAIEQETIHRKRQTAARRAAAILNAATPAQADHPYLVRKRIQPHGARIHKGALTLPVMDFTGNLASLQFIATDGGKLLLSGGRKRGCFIPVAGDIANPTRVIVCEGWATGCTLAEDEPTVLVLAAIDAGNLEPVALAARRRWPSAELVIAGDDDRLTAGNPGATKAKTAAIASGALLALPQWPEDAPDHLTDFNDLAVWLAGGGA